MQEEIEVYDYTDGEDLFYSIKDEIEQKYNITDPQFIVTHEKVLDEKEIISWMDKWLSCNKWVQYSHIRENIFELKEYFPNPPQDLCQQLADDFMSFHQNLHPTSTVCFGVDGILYDTGQSKKEILARLERGTSQMMGHGPVHDREHNRFIYNLEHHRDELGRIIDSGYMILEKRDFERTTPTEITNFLNNLKNNNKKIRYTINYVHDIEQIYDISEDKYIGKTIKGDSWYNEKEIKNELAYLFKMGKTNISFYKNPEKVDGVILYHLWVE